MNMKKFTAAAVAAVMAGSLSACGNNVGEAAEETTVSTAALSPEEQIHYDMVKRSFVQLGNTSRIEEKLAQAERGEEMTVAYIGGSITEGIGAPTKEDCYAKLSYNYIAENYGTGENVKYLNAGVSGTPSILGNLRAEKDLLVHNPDIVFIEFAVNDGGDQIYKESFESLVRTVLSQENEPAVVLLFMVTENGHTCQDYMKEVGVHYELPMISIPDAIQPEFEAGRMTWADYSDDGSHPNEHGHKLVTEFISNWFETLETQEQPAEEYTVKPVPKFGKSYENAFLVEADYDNSSELITVGETGSFALSNNSIFDFTKGSWAYTGEGTDPLKMNVRGNSLFLVCRRNNNADMGKFEVYINGAKVTTIDTNQKDGWGDPFAFQVIKWQSIRDMEVEIVPAADSTGKTIEIYAVACSQNESF